MSHRITVSESAPPPREPVEIVRRQARQFKDLGWVSAVANSMLNLVMILNSEWQIVFVSENARHWLQKRSPEDLIGLRPGEALGCIYADMVSEGCGASSYCQECGNLRAILAALEGRQAIEECQLLQGTDRLRLGAVDFKVMATPVRLGEEDYCILALTYITHEKRRQALERIFFHDLINIASGVEGLANLIASKAPEDLHRDLRLLQDGLRDMLEEISAQKDLSAAENHELAVKPVRLRTADILQTVAARYRHHPVARHKQLVVAASAADLEFSSDPSLLRRVLGNLVKNALEACRPGETVTVNCVRLMDSLRLEVHNPGLIPHPVQVQIFKRSFSTKGAGRGLGTYSVKLLVEDNLGGQVNFRSNPEEGTTFYLILPRQCPRLLVPANLPETKVPPGVCQNAG